MSEEKGKMSETQIREIGTEPKQEPIKEQTPEPAIKEEVKA